jgi:hypothetical protein
MTKKPEAEVTSLAVAPKRRPHYTDRSGCVVCGQYEPELTGGAGEARWHEACAATHPHVIAKVTKRA